MQATDFLYDGVKLSDLGFMICTFDSGSIDTASAGSTITFNTVMQHGGSYYAQTGSLYEECFTTTFDICKRATNTLGQDISLSEYRFLMTWLNRREYCKFSLIDSHDSGWNQIYFEGSFNVERVNYCGRLIGLTLTFQSNRPFGYGPTITNVINVNDTSETYSVTNSSDELGAMYPDEVIITCLEDGDLEIINTVENRVVSIDNCSDDEVITMDCANQIITSSDEDHKLYDDFNFNFLRLINLYNNRVNTFTFSITCQVTIKYRPIKKVVF